MLTEIQAPLNGFVTSYNFNECKKVKVKVKVILDQAIKAQEG
jgi:hypothetical protein